MNQYTDFPDSPAPGYGFLYFLRSPSGKGYVGQTTMSIKQRIQYHNSGGKCRALYAAIKKYGLSSFFVGEIGLYPIADLDSNEARFIQELETMAPGGYNLTSGGGANRTCSLETRALISAAGLGRRPSPEARAHMSEAHKGRRPDAAIQALTGKHRSPETRARIAASLRGKPRSDAIRARISAAKRGRPLSAAQIAGYTARRGIPPSAASRVKLREAAKAYWARRAALTEATCTPQ